jgi:hypothetical protein
MRWTEAQTQTFLSEAWDEMEVAQALMARKYGLPADRWNMDQSEGTIRLSTSAKSTFVFDATAVGSLANGSWMWAWANESILPGFSRESAELKKLRKTTGLSFFTEPVWDDLNEEDGWKASAVALKTLGGLGVFRCPISPDSSLFVLLRERFNA